jgi:MOSC domain-containing protein YiiM
MDPAREAVVVPGEGLVGNADQGGGRQVTLIEAEAWERMMGSLGGDLPGSARRANLMLRGIRLEGSLGRRLRIGEVELEVTGETRPCERMEEALPGLREEMRPDWRGGVHAVVLKGGRIRTGDRVAWVPRDPSTTSRT